MKLSVIIPTHSPRESYLARTLDGLRRQTGVADDWELLLIDNASPVPLTGSLVEWQPHGRVIREEQIGLTHARLRGIEEAQGELLIWVDDDNILQPDYLQQTVETFSSHPRLGAAGGISTPEYEQEPQAWYSCDLAPLGCRDLGAKEEWMSWNALAPAYPSHAPIGAGMVTRKEALLTWATAVQRDDRRRALGRTGAALTSGEDNDINLTLLAAGWDLAYLPQLRLTHLIPPRRLTLDYQKRIARATFRDFVKVLDMHGIRLWSPIPAWSIPWRSLRAWFTYRAWSGPAAQIRWQGAIGQFEGRAALKN